ncbi:unnamed protein product [Ixodes hexagonus]
MYLEAMHRTLKQCYLEGKRNKSVDNLISALLDMTHDQLFQRLVKLCKGKTTARMARINKSHPAALEIDVGSVLQSNTGPWHVKSQSTNDMKYEVMRVKGPECEECHLRCEECKTCVHDYTCTCQD